MRAGRSVLLATGTEELSLNERTVDDFILGSSLARPSRLVVNLVVKLFLLETGAFNSKWLVSQHGCHFYPQKPVTQHHAGNPSVPN